MTPVIQHPPPADDPAGLLSADALITLGDAQAAVWWTRTPTVVGRRPGLIGRFTAGDPQAAASVLDRACRLLSEAGCDLAIGPMDGNTWRAYRFVTWRGDAPRFALEPDQPDAWPGWWTATGFAVREEYISSAVDRLDAGDPRLVAAEARLHAQGVVIRPLVMGDFTGELQRIFTVSETAFQANVLYTPLPREEFLAMYGKIAPLVRPELCFIAECAGAPAGFVFAIPDAEQAKRGEAIDTVVVKTLAVLPDRRFAGLGKVLLERCHHAAFALGFRHAIHALMHAANGSRNLGDAARLIRRYALLAKPLR